MPPRKTQIEEAFDDDTDLPLPSVPLRNTGARGPLLEEITSPSAAAALDSDEDDDDEVGPSSGASTFFGAGSGASPAATGSRLPTEQLDSVKDTTPYKKCVFSSPLESFVSERIRSCSWTCVYPIYIDAKRKYGTGERRIARNVAVWWPLSRDIAECAHRLRLPTLHEIDKTHPRDWENPGRVRVQWKQDGRLFNANIKTSELLLSPSLTRNAYWMLTVCFRETAPGSHLS